jgi:hypothetical protein
VEDELAIERFRLAAERTGILDVESGDVPGHGQWDLGIWVSASRSPLTVDAPAGESGRLVDERVAGSLVASVALWRRLVLGFDMPLVISQDDDLDASTNGRAVGRFSVKLERDPLIRRAGINEERIPVIVTAVGSADDGIHILVAVMIQIGEGNAVAFLQMPHAQGGGYLLEIRAMVISEGAIWNERG